MVLGVPAEPKGGARHPAARLTQPPLDRQPTDPETRHTDQAVLKGTEGQGRWDPYRVPACPKDGTGPGRNPRKGTSSAIPRLEYADGAGIGGARSFVVWRRGDEDGSVWIRIRTWSGTGPGVAERARFWEQDGGGRRSCGRPTAGVPGAGQGA